MKMQTLLLLEELLRQKAVLRWLLKQYGLCEEKVQLRGSAAGGQFVVEYRCACCEDMEVVAGVVAGVLADKEDAMLFEELSRCCFPIRTGEIGIWLDNFSDITEVALVVPDNLLAVLLSSGSFHPQAVVANGFCGTYLKDEYYLPVYRIAERAEREVLLLKTGKLGILRQLIPLPAPSSGGVVKTIFHAAPDNVLREILEYLPQKGFLGYVLQLEI